MRYSSPDDAQFDSTAAPPYEPGNYGIAANIQPVVAGAGPWMVTPLDQVGVVPANVDCPYCKKVVETEVRKVDSDGSGMMQCLICLFCWPMIFCYEPDRDVNHYCSEIGCGRQLTHQPHGGRPQALPVAQVGSQVVTSQYQQFEQK